MKYRKLRIAFSAVCGIICLLLIVLWVRSYTWADLLGIRSVGTLVTSMRGNAYFGGRFSVDNSPSLKLQIHQLPQTPLYLCCCRIEPRWPARNYPIRYSVIPYGQNITIPYWFLVPLTAVIPIAPWMKWRFSLRTLLIAMTLVAVVLGLIVASK